MSMSYAYASRWLDHDGIRVTVSGIQYQIHARQMQQQYPYPAAIVAVAAVPVNKRTKAYRAMKQRLGDDWSTDILGSGPETEFLFWEAVQTVVGRRQDEARFLEHLRHWLASGGVVAVVTRNETRTYDAADLKRFAFHDDTLGLINDAGVWAPLPRGHVVRFGFQEPA